MPSENAPSQYQIRIKGHLRVQIGLIGLMGSVSCRDETGNTLLTGDVVDQARLHGLLKRIRDAGMELISVNPITETDEV